MKQRTPALVSILLTLFMAQAMSQDHTLRDHHKIRQVKEDLRKITRHDQNHLAFPLRNDLMKDSRFLPHHQVLPLKKVNAMNLHAAGDMGEPPDLNWSGQFGGSAFDGAGEVITDDDGNVYMTGTFSGDIEVQSTSLTSVEESDAIVAKFDDSGNLVWITQLSPAEGEIIAPGGLCLDDDGNVCLTGAFTGDVQFGSTSLASQGVWSLFFAKLGSAGNVLMASGHESANEQEMGTQIGSDLDGNIYILGTGLDEDLWMNYSLILKFDPSGALLWEQEHDEIFNGMAVNGDAICLSGEYNDGEHDGILDEDVVLPMSDFWEAVVAKADLNGDFKWASLSGHVVDPYSWSNTRGQNIGLDENRDIYITGTFANNAIFGTDTLFSEGIDGQFIAKCDSLGEFLWATKLPIPWVVDHFTEQTGTNYMVCPGSIIKVDSAGTILWSQEIFQNPGAIAVNPSGKLITSGSDMGLIFVSQMDQMADQEWQVKFVGNSGLGEVIGMVADHHGNLYTYGSASNVMEFFGESVQLGEFICKQDRMGEVIWMNQFPGIRMDHSMVGDQLYIDTINHFIYIIGVLLDTMDIPGQSLHIPDEEGSMVILKYDLNGDYIWSLQEDFNSLVTFSISGAVTADRSGNAIISGTFKNTVTIGDQDLVSAGDADAYVAKYDANGNFLWAKRAGGEFIEYLSIVTTDASDNIYLAGEFHSTAVTVDQTDLEMEVGDGNIILAKFNPGGEVQWVETFASTKDEWRDDLCWPTGIRASGDGSVYMKGCMSDTAYFDQIRVASPFDGYNKFIARFDADGNVLWANGLMQHNTSRRYDFWFDYSQFDIDSEGSVYFGGQVSDTMDFGDEFRYIPAGATDLYVAKYTAGGVLEWVKGIQGNEIDESLWLQSVAVYGTGNVFIGGDFNGPLMVDDQTLTSPATHGFIAMLGPDITGPTTVCERQKDAFDLYPNPSDGLVMLTTGEMQGRYVDVINQNGQVVHSEIIRSDIQQVQLSHLSRGLYLVWIRDTDYATAKKLIIGP